MTLDNAFARVAQTHPELRLVDARATVLAAKPVGLPNEGEWPDPMIPGATPPPDIPASLLP